ncbi:MAG: FAD-dependent oxidoreductase, partial [Planctomycetota bacterium]
MVRWLLACISWLLMGLVCDGSIAAEPAQVEADIVVYGGTSAGVMAAIASHRSGKTVVLVGPDKHLGGLSAGGLGWTDTGNKAVIGGLAREFYHRIYQHYQNDDAWRWQRREDYGNRGQGTPAVDGKERTMWIFEPHAAEQVFEDMIREARIPVHRDRWLDRTAGVTMEQGRITSIRMLDGTEYRGKVFIDATYEGDLMAAAGCDYHVGREGNDVYGETWNGVQKGVFHHSHYFRTKISPYWIPGDPSSGVLPRISTEPPGENGTGDHRVQAYCYRMCLTQHPDNRIPFPKPEGYDPRQYELLLRVLHNEWREVFQKFDPIPNLKTDTNNHGPFSTDNIGMNYDYPDATYERRREILQEHETYQKGLMYFLANDPRVPEDVQREFAKWGLAADEFRDNGGWPHQIYVREARRMVGSYVMTEHDVLGRRRVPSPVGMGSYALDSHNVQRYITEEGYVQNEGDIGVRVPRPYSIAYQSLTPKRAQCQNLLVPVCLSCSHIAYGSIRMEPVFMILGHSAGAAASISVDQQIAVQDVPYPMLAEKLHSEGQVLQLEDVAQRHVEGLPGVVVDDLAAQFNGDWGTSSSTQPFIG